MFSLFFVCLSIVLSIRILLILLNLLIFGVMDGEAVGLFLGNLEKVGKLGNQIVAFIQRLSISV